MEKAKYYIGRILKQFLYWFGNEHDRRLAKTNLYQNQMIEKSFFDKNVILNKSQLTYAQDLLYTYNTADFLHDEKFIAAYNKGKDTNSRLISSDGIEWRIHVLCWAAKHASQIDGDFVECGVNTGIFSSAITHYIDFETTGKTLYLLDTFEGLVEKYCTPEEIERNKKLEYKNNIDIYKQVQETFRAYSTKIIKGPIPDTLPQIDADKIAFVSMDLNSAYPERAALDFLWNKIVPGGIIVFDDYGYNNSHKAQKKEHDDFAKSKSVEVLTLPTCQGMIIKP